MADLNVLLDELQKMARLAEASGLDMVRYLLDMAIAEVIEEVYARGTNEQDRP